MKYNVKWVKDHLGISRKALRNFEDHNLLPKVSKDDDISKYPKNGLRNPENRYREYDDEDIERIWSYKILQGIGFKVREIKEFVDNPDFDLQAALTDKICELERERDAKTQYIEFAKSIKLTGRIPTVTKLGMVNYNDFIRYARENWNFFSDPQIAPYSEMVDDVIAKPPSDWSLEDLNELGEIIKTFNDNTHSYNVNAYFRLISELRIMDYACKPVQIVVGLLYEYLRDFHSAQDSEVEYTPLLFAKYISSSFLFGDIAELNKHNYGEEGCFFIAQAIAYYGGYDINDIIQEVTE